MSCIFKFSNYEHLFVEASYFFDPTLLGEPHCELVKQLETEHQTLLQSTNEKLAQLEWNPLTLLGLNSIGSGAVLFAPWVVKTIAGVVILSLDGWILWSRSAAVPSLVQFVQREIVWIDQVIPRIKTEINNKSDLITEQKTAQLVLLQFKLHNLKQEMVARLQQDQIPLTNSTKV